MIKSSLFLKVILLFGLACAATSLTSCDKKPPKQPMEQTAQIINEEKMTEQTLQDPHNLPAQVPFTDEQRLYLAEVTQAVLRVISKRTTLEKEEALFGEGHYHWPKAPGPIKFRYYYKKPRYQGFGLSFERLADDQIWFTGSFGFTPKNFPRGVYLMDLPASFFAGFTLEKVFAENRPDESIKRVNIFKFRLNEGNQNIQLQFEAREDVSSLQDKFPKSFHLLKVTRIGE